MLNKVKLREEIDISKYNERRKVIMGSADTIKIKIKR